tara:strand:- start:81 stop:596 length:516 start_codon:yes stop_codon:yes gene_type:complete
MKIKLKYWFTFIIYLAINVEIAAAKPIKNHFVGQWTIDFDKTFFEYPSLLMAGNSEMLNLFQDNYRVKFFIEGQFEESISKSTLTGTWSRYDETSAVVRLESDKSIMSERIRYKNRIDISTNRYKKTRDYQRLYKLNRASVRKYHYLDGYLSQQVDLGDRVIRLFLKRISL